MARTYFNVSPRYTPGSPAMVDQDTALRVVDEERRGHEATLQGIYGAEAKANAEAAGLAGIVEEITERADCWLVTDLITGRQFIRMFPAQETEARRRMRAFRLRAKYNREVEVPNGA